MTTSSVRAVFREQWQALRSLPFKPVFILLTATAIQLVARFHTSRSAFREIFYDSFGQHGYFQLYEHLFWLLGDFLLQFPLLLLLIRFALKENSLKYGVVLGNWKVGLKVSLGFWIIMLPILWFVSADASFLHLHPAPDPAKTRWAIFLVYQAASLIYLIGWEFIWRGYVLFGLKETFGSFAIIIQMIPFALLHIGAPELEAYSSIIAGIGLGMLAFATRSFWYGVLAHALVLGTMDLLGALRFRSGIMGVGLNDFVEMLRSVM